MINQHQKEEQLAAELHTAYNTSGSESTPCTHPRLFNQNTFFYRLSDEHEQHKHNHTRSKRPTSPVSENKCVKNYTARHVSDKPKAHALDWPRLSRSTPIFLKTSPIGRRPGGALVPEALLPATAQPLPPPSPPPPPPPLLQAAGTWLPVYPRGTSAGQGAGHVLQPSIRACTSPPAV